jgi:hypothetical protein
VRPLPVAEQINVHLTHAANALEARHLDSVDNAIIHQQWINAQPRAYLPQVVLLDQRVQHV